MNEHNIHGMMNVIVSLLKSIIESKISKNSLKSVLYKKSLMIGGPWPRGPPLDPPMLPVHRDQLRTQRLVTSMGELYLFH